MSECEWEEIPSFKSPGEFEKFQDWMKARIQDGDARDIPVRSYHYAGDDPPTDWNEPGRYWHLEEKWYQHLPSGQVWRLLWPDGPQGPSFTRVKESELRSRP